MLEKIFRTIEKIVPPKLYEALQPLYHRSLAFIGALIYGFPSKSLKIVAITGTKGKTSTTEILNTILEAAGYKTALQNGIRFKVGDEEELNLFKMTTPGRFFMQKFLNKAKKAHCDWVVTEITSEAARLFRHKHIDLDGFIFTNLAPEHIERHGSYEAYRDAKLSIADSLQNKQNTLLVVNGDDKEAEHFMQKDAAQKIAFHVADSAPYELKEDGVTFRFGKTTIYSKLPGRFNLENMIAAATFARAIGISEDVIKNAIESIDTIRGRAEKIKNDKGIDVYVDYAHTAESLQALYQTFADKKLICVLGATGGGRDKWKRPKMGEMADLYCSEIILTNDDPYEEDPMQIVEEMKTAIVKNPVHIQLDRRVAIREALAKVKHGEVVLITGKGTDPYLMEAGGKKTPWSDADIVREELEKLIVNN